jgi:hypothetical protein
MQCRSLTRRFVVAEASLALSARGSVKGSLCPRKPLASSEPPGEDGLSEEAKRGEGCRAEVVLVGNNRDAEMANAKRVSLLLPLIRGPRGAK